MSSTSYSDEQVKLIFKLRDDNDLSWKEVADEYNQLFDRKTSNALRKVYKRFSGVDFSDDSFVSNLKAKVDTQKKNLKLAKENKIILDNQLNFDDILKGVKSAVKEVKHTKIKLPKKVKKSKSKTNMTIEALVSDVHYGLETKSYNTDIARKRIKKLSDAVLDERKRYSKNYNIERIHLAIIGDIMQSESLHRNSGRSCDKTNAEQISISIISLFNDLILPIANTGLPIDITGLCGNHDREAKERFTVNPGITYFTYTIYTALEELCKVKGLKNVTFSIPIEPYVIVNFYGHNFLYEHGDLVPKGTSVTLEQQLLKRSGQVGKILKGIRIGHYHNDFVGGMGRHIINGSTVSDDHYGNMLGYKSRPCQIINFYVKTKRDTSFYHSFPVNLDD